MKFRVAAAAIGAVLAAAPGWSAADAQGAPANTPGVTSTEIKIGHTIAYSGPASAYGVIGKAESAFFRMVNDQGGVAGHKIIFISYDDGYTPPKTVEQVRRLIEQDEVDFLFNTLGTPTNSAVERYVNQKKVPMLFVATGADKWGDYPQESPHFDRHITAAWLAVTLWDASCCSSRATSLPGAIQSTCPDRRRRTATGRHSTSTALES